MIGLSGARGRGVGLLAVVVATAVLAGLTPWPVSRPAWRDQLRTQIASALSAGEVDLGEINITLLPVPRLEITGLTVEGTAATLTGSASRARLTLDLPALLLGRAQATGLALDGAAVTLRLPRPLGREPKEIAAHLAAASRVLSDVEARTGIGRLSLTGGTLALTDAHGGQTDLHDLTFAADFARPDAPVRLDLTARLGDEAIRFGFSGATPALLTKGTAEPVSLSLNAGGWTVDVKGQGSLASDGSLNGTVKGGFARGSAAGLAALGLQALPPVNFSATVEGSARGVTLSDLAIQIDRDRYQGVGAARIEKGRWQLSATLATESADISWAVRPFLHLRDEAGSWNRERISGEALLATTLDLRLSADRLKINNSLLDRAALTLLTRPARFEAALGEARLNGGTARARLVAIPSADGVDLKLSASLDGADFGKTFAEAGLERRVRGTGSASLGVEASGRSVAELVASTNGRMQLALRDGDLLGIDLNRLADRRASRPGAALTEALTGKTPFESIVLTSRVTQGAIGPVEGRLQAGRIVGALQGIVDLPQGQHKLGGTIVQIGGEAFPVEPVPILEFSVNGPLTAPKIEPNLQALLNRS